MCKVFFSLLLIFTPQTRPAAAGIARNGRAATHVHHEPGLDVWAALIAFTDCPDVVLLDRFQFLADRPLFARQLFVRATAAGHRVSVRRHLGALEQLPAATHRLAIIVPIVINPPRVTTDELERFFVQLADQSNYVEFFRWLFVFEPPQTAAVWGALRDAPIRPDSHVYCVSIAGVDEPPPFGHRVHLERKMMLPSGRAVRRMQMVPHPEANPPRTAVSLRLDGANGGNVSVWQLYRLHTRTSTIDVAVELV
uniref:Secreted protein n=1 Tax=Anopheles dirus TaxID=7168 RepID=A0A182N6J0_9DIPT